MEGKISYSPVLRVRRFIERVKSERGSPRLKRMPSRTLSEEAKNNSTPNSSPLHLRKSLKREIQPYTGENQFLNIPSEATMFIFSFLEVEDLNQVRLVSREWLEFADDDLVWKSLCIYDWNIQHKLLSSWKKTYIQLDDLFSDGVWEGMSKWNEPPNYSNEQKTTARLHFMKRTRANQLEALMDTPKASPTVLHRVDSQANSISVKPAQIKSKPNYKDSLYKINGGGVTINLETPSPFKIEGERTHSDESGFSFTWNKQFEKHTSVYQGKLDYTTGTVSGTIEYNDGSTLWIGEFNYRKAHSKTPKKYRSAMA